MSRPRQPPSAAGFTLVETLVALAVSLAIGALLYAIFLGGWRAWESTTRAAAWTARAPDLVQQLQADLAARHHLAGFIPEGDAAGFTLLRPARRPHPELIQVTYRWESAARRLRRTEQPWVWPGAASLYARSLIGNQPIRSAQSVLQQTPPSFPVPQQKNN